MPNQAHEYDVAISFLSRDEPLALQLAALLAPLRVFVYSKNQEAVAGREGIDAFRTVFREQSRLSVVLLRQNWGDTPWTAVEEAAIRDACLEHRFENLFIYRVERSAALPSWTPRTHIVFEAELYPIEQAVGAIKGKVQELGAIIEPPSALSRARRAAAVSEFDKETVGLMESGAAAQAAVKSFQECVRQAVVSFETIANENPSLELRGEAVNSNLGFTVTADRGAAATLGWKGPRNTVVDAGIVIRTFDGRLMLPSEQANGYRYNDNGSGPPMSQEVRFKFVRTMQLGFCWEHGGQSLTEAQVVERLFDLYFERFEKVRIKPK